MIDRIQPTVKKIASLIEASAKERRLGRLSEEELRFELVACILSSQVSAESVDLAMMRLTAAGLLENSRWMMRDEGFESEVSCALSNRGNGAGYRFPRAKAKQLFELRRQLQIRSIRSRLSVHGSIGNMRASLVTDLPGVGPKQASLFLRNIGRTTDIAVIDSHVLRFFKLIGLLSWDRVSTLEDYEQAEAVVIGYACAAGCKPAFLDWAIWITMRAARELRL